MRAVAYYRMSSDKQETSIPDQSGAIRARIAKDGHKITEEYRDDGISGDDTAKRLGFQRMIADAKAGRFDLIYVWDLSRLGRFDVLEGGFWLKPLRDAGVQIVTLDRGLL